MAVTLLVTGTLSSATVVLDFLRGDVGTRATVAIGAAAQLIGGTLLWRQPYPLGPDTVRKSWGIVAIAIGSSVLVYSSQNFLSGLTDGTDLLGLLSVSSLVLGSGLLVAGTVSVGSRRYAHWFKRKWEERERRQIRVPGSPQGASRGNTLGKQ
jgi:hypothetical protein